MRNTNTISKKNGIRPSPTATLRIRNRGNATLTYTATTKAGETETGTVAAGGVVDLDEKLYRRGTIADTYPTITVQYAGEEARTVDTTTRVTETIMVLEFTNWSGVDVNMVTIVNDTGSEVTLTYKGTDDQSDTTQTIAIDGAFDLPDGVASGDTIGDVYTKLVAAWGEASTFSPALTTVITEDTVIYITANWTIDDGQSGQDQGFGGQIGGDLFPMFP